MTVGRRNKELHSTVGIEVSCNGSAKIPGTIHVRRDPIDGGTNVQLTVRKPIVLQLTSDMWLQNGGEFRGTIRTERCGHELVTPARTVHGASRNVLASR